MSSFFWVKLFFNFSSLKLKYYTDYVELIENNSLLLLEKLYKERTKSFYPRGLKINILKTISVIQEKSELQSQSEDRDEEENIEIKIPPQFNKTFNIAIIQ